MLESVTSQDIEERGRLETHDVQETKMEVVGLDAWYSKKQALIDVNLNVRSNKVTAIIGPSGCGKSTLIRCLNRMHELVPGSKVTGSVLLDGKNIYGSDLDPVDVRRRVGMVFQKPNPFPNMSIADNVTAGLKLAGVKEKTNMQDVERRTLERVGLWDEVKDDLKRSGASLSGGQQQRLCIARALAIEPEVILMDEPCSALDPTATAKIEQLITSLSKTYTVVIVTHNMQQAARVSDVTAFFNLSAAGEPGRLVEVGKTADMFTKPTDPRTEAYITGRFG